MTRPFRLLTINTWKCDGNYRQRLALLKTQIGALTPDVVFCQEVFWTEGADTGRELANALGMHYAYAPARHKPRLFEGQLTGSESGLGLLSRYPIRQTDALALPTDNRDGDRLAQFAQLDVNGRLVLVINAHLTHLRNSSVLRQQQLDTLLAHPWLNDSYDAIFLAGDFNAEISSSEMQFLFSHPIISARNTYTAGGGLLPGHTMPSRTADQPEQGRCIDFIFSLARHPAHHPDITSARVVLDTPDAAGNYPSDHCGLLIQTQLLTRDNRNPIFNY